MLYTVGGDVWPEHRKIKIYKESQIFKGCHMCGIGNFHLMAGSDYMWCCDHCKYIGHIRVYPGE